MKQFTASFWKRLFTALFLPVIFITNNTGAQVKVTSSLFGSLTARQIGPAPMSGRITAIDAVNSDPRIMYVGAAGGGVWKTINGGAVLKSVFDKYAQSIGAITIDQKNPSIVWVGTGESNMRNSVTIGDGLYKSDDGGDNWKKVGLENTNHIAKIVVDPGNSNIVYVAAPGPLWGNSEDRGLYKTNDGGTTWEKILYIDEKTGCAEIVMDPKNPNVLYASMWEFRRKPWAFSSGGEGSGLYKSIDGGQSWDRIDQSFTDDGVLGRICLAISPTDTKSIYAIAESKNTGLYESNDGGETWKRNSASGNVVARPFYFSVIAVDPTDGNRIYRPAFSLSISDDGGQSFRESSFEGGWVHADHHAIWINPNNPQNIYLGTDGGMYVSFDRGNNFIFINNLPVAQYYHVNYDLQKPFYNVYGGLQDNGSWIGPSNSPGGIQAGDWQSIGFGDGFQVVPDLQNTEIVYWEMQGGGIHRYNKVTTENKSIKPQTHDEKIKLRFNWNTPIHQSTLNPGTIYTGAQFLYRTRNMGNTWERISPDLTTNDPEKQKQDESGGLSVDNSSAENHCTIFTICESPLDANIIWVGTDDGNLQVTANGGASWENVVKNIPGLPKNAWVSSVDAGRFDKNTAFVTFDNHALGDMKTYIYKTTDMGKSWSKLVDTEIKGYAHKIKQDLVNPNLLFAGTVFGLFLSLDGGTSWIQYNSNVPAAEVRDLEIHPETHDLIVATHGRGVLILDDLSPIRGITTELLNTDAAFLPTRENFTNSGFLNGSFPDQAGSFTAPNSTEDAVITYYLKERAVTGDVKIEIYDPEGKLVKTVPGTKRKGINRVTWDMRVKTPKVAKGIKPDFSGFFSPYVRSGEYKLKLLAGNNTVEGALILKVHPFNKHSQEDLDLQYETSMKLHALHEELAFLVENINKVQQDAQKLADESKADKDLVKELVGKLEDIRKTLVATKEGRITGEVQLREKIGEVYMSVAGYNGRPTDSQLERIPALENEVAAARKNAEEIYSKYLAKLNIVLMTREEFDKKTQ